MTVIHIIPSSTDSHICCIYEKQILNLVEIIPVSDDPEEWKPLYSIHLFGNWYMKYNNKNYKVL